MANADDDDFTAVLAATLPKGEANGLAPFARDFADFPKKMHVAVIVFDAPVQTTDAEKDITKVKVRIRRVELIREKGDKSVMERLLMRALETRTGATTLPFDLETEISKEFQGIDDERLAQMEREERDLAEREAADAAEDASTVYELPASAVEKTPEEMDESFTVEADSDGDVDSEEFPDPWTGDDLDAATGMGVSFSEDDQIDPDA